MDIHANYETKTPSAVVYRPTSVEGLFLRSGRGARRVWGTVLMRLAMSVGLLLAAASIFASSSSAREIHVFAGTFGAAASTPANPYPLANPTAVAVDEQSHDVYVNDPANHRVEKFDSTGHFLLMFGKEVDKTKVEEAGTTKAEQDLCTAASGDVCQAGSPGTTVPAFEDPAFLAVDNSPGGESDVYVADAGTRGNEVQTVTVNATGGTFTLSFKDPTSGAVQTTGVLSFEATTEEVEQALFGLPAIGGDDVSVSGNKGGPYRVEFKDHLAYTNVEQLLSDGSKLTGGAKTVEVTTQVQGFNTARVLKFDSSGLPAESWGDHGRLAVGEMDTMQVFDGIVVDSSGNLDVFVFGPNKVNGGPPNGLLLGFDRSGTPSRVSETSSAYPFGLALDARGSLFYSRKGSPQVWKYEASLAGITESGDEVTRNLQTSGLVMDTAFGDLYVDDATEGGMVRRYRLVGSDEVGEPDSSTCTFGGPEKGCLPTESFGKGHLSGGAGLAVDSSTHAIFVADTASGEVSVFGRAIVPDVTTGQASSVGTTSATLNGTVNPDGLQVTECKFEYVVVGEYQQNASNPYVAGHTVPCEETVGGGSAPVAVHAEVSGLQEGVFYHFRLVAGNANGQSQGQDVELAPPGSPIVCGESADGVTSTKAVLHAQVNPHSVSTSYHFEYLTEAQFREDGETFGAGTVDTQSGSVGSDYVCHPVAESLGGLAARTAYRWRVVAENAKGVTDGPPQALTTLPPALVEGPWTTEVSAYSVTLNARVNPLGSDTNYSFEYGTNTSYGQMVGGTVGQGEAFVTIAQRLEVLPDTVYHYRLVTTSATGTVTGPDLSFTTQAAASEGLLLDERAWEQVTPTEKHGANILFEAGAEDVQAAADGNGIAYIASGPVTERGRASSESIMVISTRRPDHWESAEPMPAKRLPEKETQADELTGLELPPPFLSSNLGLVLIDPTPYIEQVSREATEHTIYIYDTATGIYKPLVTEANVEKENEPFGGKSGTDQIQFAGATPDLGHVVLASPFALTKEAVRPPDLKVCEENNPCYGEDNLYEWVGGRLHLVNILPSGQSIPYAVLGRASGSYGVHAISNNGRWIVWTRDFTPGQGVLYVRDMVAEKTFNVGGEDSVYETMSGDGSRVFYLEGGDLHVLETATRAQVDLTSSHGAGEPNAGVQDTILGASEDGSYVYVVANGVLTGAQENANGESAVAGQPNAYVLHDTGSGWTTTFVATLSAEDERDWSAVEGEEQQLGKVTAHVSPDGRWLAFMSERSLTGYDNVDAESPEGEPRRDEEVFLYDAASAKLLCASCNPTGERPHGVLDEGMRRTLVDTPGAWTGHWLAASMPGWRTVRSGFPMYQPRMVLDSGRLFFQSADALVAQDTNGQQDVYEYEPAGLGGVHGCSEGVSKFSPAAGGCISLVSSGTSSQESIFYDASLSGDDVFFTTNSRLDPARDLDEATDLYDARVGGGFPVAPAPPSCEGDRCQTAVVAPIDETPSSLSYSGPGNVPPGKKTIVHCRKREKHQHGRCVKVRKHHKGKHRRKPRKAKRGATVHKHRGGEK